MRDKYLTETMGGKWHTVGYTDRDIRRGIICNCGSHNCAGPSRNLSLSTWEGFGKLWEFISTHPARWEMAGALKCGRSSINGGKFLYLPEELIHPDRLADAVYEFLKERNG